MGSQGILLLMATYFGLLILLSYLVGKDDDNDSFFVGKRNSPWYIVAFGMIGASLSGVTFISVPGWVGSSSFSYMQMVLGYLLGYALISNVLLPIYYKLGLTSIYGYLRHRFGRSAHITGSSFFILSRIIGASFRLYLVAMVLQLLVFDQWAIPFWQTVVFTVALIWLYTFRSGIKTIVWTDTLQTLFMLLSVILTLVWLGDELIGAEGWIAHIRDSPNSTVFVFGNLKEPTHFVRYFFSGALITLVMTGLDQDMMQKNLSCRTLKESKRNMFWFSISLVFVNLIFMVLGLLLNEYAQLNGMDVKGDELFPTIVMENGSAVLAGLFIVGLIAAAYSSADSALTSLTTSFCVDILEIKESQVAMRKYVHVGFSLVLILVVVGFKYVVNEHVVSDLFRAAGYTYGPLLGLFAFGITTKKIIKEKWIIPAIAIASPFISWQLSVLFFKYYAIELGFEVLALNGLITYCLLILSARFSAEIERQSH